MKIFSLFGRSIPNWAFPWGLIAAFVFFVAAFFRLSHLGSLPQGLSWDEAFLGYVGRMVITTGRDEHSDLLPVVFTSFGDYKAPLAVYVTGLSTTLFGVSTWATRLPFALAGILTVGLVSGITWFRTKSWAWSLFAAWILAVLPWHIHFSRIAFESGLATFFFALFLLSWQALRHLAAAPNKTKMLWWSALIIGVLGSVYTYHSSKIVLPLSIATIVAWETFFSWPTWKARWKEITHAGIWGTVGLLPFVWGLWNGGLNRATQTLFWQHLHTEESWFTRLLSNVTAHANWKFLVQGSTDSLRHGTGEAGVLTGTLVLALVLGSAWLVWKTALNNDSVFSLQSIKTWWQTKQSAVPKDGLFLWTLLLIIGFLPAIIGFEVPHSNRALLAVIPLVILTIEVLIQVQANLHGNAKQTLIASIILFSALESSAFWHDLTNDYAARSSAAWMEGTVEMSTWAGQAAESGASVAISKQLGEPEIFFGFANNWSIERYRNRDFGSVSFVDQDQLESSSAQRVVSAQPLADSRLTLLQEIRRQDGLTTYWIYARE